MPLVDLPTDIIVLLWPYLSARDFLSFTSTTRSLLPYRSDASFWRDLARATFRVPANPLLDSNGTHWLHLYRSLRDQTCVFTWGNDGEGNLGHLSRERAAASYLRGRRQSSGWPYRMKNLEDLGVIADVQCGGSSTVLLNESGDLWALGVLKTMSGQKKQLTPIKLKFPNGWPESTKARYIRSTAIREFSLCRHRLLGLADDNRIWQWDDFGNPAQLVFFFTLPNDRERRLDPHRKVTKVVSGWGLNTAYFRGVGIVTWTDVVNYNEASPTDSMIVAHVAVLASGTSSFTSEQPNTASTRIGEVMNYVVLEEFIVFFTRENYVYFWKIGSTDKSNNLPRELPSFYEPGAKIMDIQGGFRRFGILTRAGKVLLGEQDMLSTIWNRYSESDLQIPPTILPMLQNSGVISLAFGDWHFHALHTDGTVTSYGHEPKGCGALGLGSRNLSYLRGVYFAQRPAGDGVLQTPSWSNNSRRTVWFEEEKERWLSDTCQKAATSEARPRALAIAADSEAVALIGEWFEREGSDWEDGPEGRLKGDPFQTDPFLDNNGLSVRKAFHVLKVSAGGWSSAALVLVDKAHADQVRKRYIRVSNHSSRSIYNLNNSNGTSRLGTDSEPSWVSTQLRSVSGWLLGSQSPITATGNLSITGTSPAPNAVATQDLAPGSNNIDLGPNGLADVTNGTPQLASTAESSHSASLDFRLPRNPQHEDQDAETYIWDDQPFPRLRFPDGSVMEGDVPITAWKNGEPKEMRPSTE